MKEDDLRSLNEIPAWDDEDVTSPSLATNRAQVAAVSSQKPIREQEETTVRTSTIGTPSIEPILKLKPVPEVVKPPKPTTRYVLNENYLMFDLFSDALTNSFDAQRSPEFRILHCLVNFATAKTRSSKLSSEQERMVLRLSTLRTNLLQQDGWEALHLQTL